MRDPRAQARADAAFESLLRASRATESAPAATGGRRR
jgi:hypothetical protein